jgi:hypothetical protein
MVVLVQVILLMARMAAPEQLALLVAQEEQGAETAAHILDMPEV